MSRKHGAHVSPVVFEAELSPPFFLVYPVAQHPAQGPPLARHEEPLASSSLTLSTVLAVVLNQLLRFQKNGASQKLRPNKGCFYRQLSFLEGTKILKLKVPLGFWFTHSRQR